VRIIAAAGSRKQEEEEEGESQEALAMTRMGLRNLVCVISSGSTTEASSSERSCGSEQAEGDQEYSPSSEGAVAAAAAAAPSLSSKCMNSSSSRESWHGGGHDHHGRASAAATVAHEPVSPASGGTHMFSCFHACAINLVQTHLLMSPLSSTNFFVFDFFSFPSHLLTKLSGATSATSSSFLYKLLFGGVHGLATKSFSFTIFEDGWLWDFNFFVVVSYSSSSPS
jgi:hypothetical protein